jgi:predicted 3-demethylubiquinone-9 3-methyltransferase (glyoxalase superfamily)
LLHRIAHHVDLWEKLTAGGGEPGQCGWLKDKFGLSWQIVPSILLELLDDKDPVKRDNVVKVVLQMEKLDMRKLQKAAAKRKEYKEYKERS